MLRACYSWSFTAKVLEATRSGCCVVSPNPRFLMCSLFIIILASQLQSLSFLFKDLGLCLVEFLPLLMSSFYWTQWPGVGCLKARLIYVLSALTKVDKWNNLFPRWIQYCLSLHPNSYLYLKTCCTIMVSGRKSQWMLATMVLYK